ncbi:hypothetical protein P170DRAFT_439771 [Aspergillus steynii IBT 23096]|uniref:Integrase zinc-binding domain-containing protein n=1 Tax=Aspergillus steynii IBT 23096 TaxID=1392250 RepID=A0A2I2FZM8_9EURO|nr:uncharacterized protein P170DRAFT_439771 [Aspergillus steynii IBT 23096]PLB46083.1 hypothetical protein P170DRAFT_439771 [Aspergillus steynii IBT 23096]
MSGACAGDLASFNESTKLQFLQYLSEHPSNRRVSSGERDTIVEWLTTARPQLSSQREFSRRNYVRKAFRWTPATQSLTAVPKKGEPRERAVVTEDQIPSVVEATHEHNGHAGWDATWDNIRSSYYGILRSDVIFLLKRCQICAGNPSKRPKGSATMKTGSTASSPDLFDFVDFEKWEHHELSPTTPTTST